MNSKSAIIILNWNGWEDTIECLESLYQITYPNYNVIVVDNGSEDDSIEKIKEYCKGKIIVESKFFEYSSGNKPIKIIEYTREETETGRGEEREILDLPSNRKMILIKNEKNYGFAEGNNIGMRYALRALNPDYFLLLNNDTVVEPHFVTELVEVAQNDSNVGILGPKIYYYHEPQTIYFAGGMLLRRIGQPFHIGLHQTDNGRYDRLRGADFITGCALLIRSEVINKIGLLDPYYFAYNEDLDWCVRAKKAGYRIMFVPQAKIWHKGTSTLELMSPAYMYLTTRNRILFVRKNATILDFVLLFVPYFIAIRIIRPIFLFSIRRKWGVIKALVAGIKDGISNNPKNIEAEILRMNQKRVV